MCWSNPNMRSVCWLTGTKATIIWGLMAGVVVGFGLVIYWLTRPLTPPFTLPILTRLTNEDMEMEYAYRAIPLG